MEVYQRKVLRKCKTELEEELDPLDVLDELINQQVMSVDDKRELEAIDSQEDRVRCLVSAIQKSSGKAFQIFLDALEKCGRYNDIVQELKSREKSAEEAYTKNCKDIITVLGGKEQFIFCKMICDVAEAMTKLDAVKICEHYRCSEQVKKSFQRTGNHGYEVIKCLLEKGVITARDVKKLESNMRQLNLTDLGKILHGFFEIQELPALEITINYPDQDSVFTKDKFACFAIGQSLNLFFRDKFNAVFEDFTRKMSFILRIPYLKSLQNIVDNIKSGELAKELMPLILIHDFSDNVDGLQFVCGEEEYSRVKGILLKSENEETEKTVVSHKEFEFYLEKVGLKGQYPTKMTLQMVTKIRLIDRYHARMKKTDIPLLFLIMLTSLDRRVVFPEKLNFHDSVRDFICALLHCSDDFLKQHILEKFAACQLAVPIIIPKPIGGEPTFVLWALRRIVKKWKDEKDSLTPERNMVTEPVFTVAFLRIGELPISKSHILNNMFGRAQSNASVAYFISKREDYQDDATFSKGSLEGNWYVPLKGKHGEILNELTLFLNLRGDATDFPKQVKFASKMADLVFILVDRAYESQSKSVIDKIEHFSSKVFTVSLKERIKNTNSQSRKKLIEEISRLEYEIDGEDIVLSTKLCEIIKTKCHCTTSDGYRSIENWSQICRSLGEEIAVDEENKNCSEAFNKCQNFFKQISSLTVQQIKEKHMKLQELELEWVKWDQKRATKNEGRTIEFQEDNIRTEKRKIRMRQSSHELTPEMLTFRNTLRDVTIGKDSKLLHYFMTHFQAQIDKMVKKEIPPHITKISRLENDLARTKLQLKEEKRKTARDTLEENIAKLQKDILKESKEYSHKHIGFEHFLRELSHLFEARIVDPNSDHEETHMMATLAAILLIQGYPLEILDGDTAYISIKWISKVLNIVDLYLGSPKIFVISVIGVQSSGKSTLLNCMFGVRFTVRAGRCTRGLFLQMLEVDDAFQKDLGFQYLLIIDTEGLQSPDRTVKNDFKFDNALATLAMCIVDLSILNISQETIGSDMIGILQIAAHALIRMRKVQLISQCRIVHQRVSDVNAAGENKSSMNVIKEALDKATLAAAKEENIAGITEFSDVFPFTEKDNLYIPCLWMGNMSPPNHSYSETILNLKSQILSTKGNEARAYVSQFTLQKFRSRLEDVWDALKKEDFVFNFQNSFNALSYQRFRLEHNKWVAVMRTAMVEWELINKENVREGYVEVYYKNLKKELRHHHDKVLKEIDEYVNSHTNEEEVKRQQNTFKIFTNNIAREIEEAIKDNFRYYMKTTQEKASLPNFIEKCKMKLRKKAKQKALEVRRKDPNLDPKASKKLLDKLFDTLWKDTSEELKKDYEARKVKEELIIASCENSLSTLVDNTKYNLKFQNIIKKRKGIVLANTECTIPKQPKQSKWDWKKIFTLGLLSGNVTNDRERDSMQRIENIAVEELNNFIADDRFEAFDKSHIDKFFTALLEQLRDYLVWAEEFALKTLVITCDHIAKVSIERQTNYEEKYSLYKLMEVEKCGLRKDFFSFFDDTITTERVAERTYSEIGTKICEKLVDHLNVKLLERLRKLNCFIDKQYLIGTILCEICRSESKEGYLKFISDQDGYITSWLQRKEIEEVTKVENSQLWIEKVAQEKLDDLKTILANSLKRTKNHFDEKYNNTCDLNDNAEVTKSKERTIEISTWRNIFVEKCRGEDLMIDLGPLFFDSVHYISFTKKLLTLIDKTSLLDIKLEPELKSCRMPVNAKKLISKMGIKPHLDILKQVKGCSKVCPFCKVGCYRQNEHSKHAAILHYPQGLAGFKNYNTKELVVDICTSSVASDSTYRFKKDEEFRPYKDYEKEFTDWDIKPIQKDEPNKHWQWVMSTFNEFIAQHYGVEPGIIPPGWKTLSKEEALESLIHFYNIG